jgi:hypothetical protein
MNMAVGDTTHMTYTERKELGQRLPLMPYKPGTYADSREESSLDRLDRLLNGLGAIDNGHGA